jgi:hypothetical protein
MTVVRAQARRRWLVVGAVAVALVAAPGVVAALPVHAPTVDLDTLVTRIRSSAGQAYEGYALSTGTAGLPALPQLSDVSDLLDGETRLRVWYAASDRWRIDVVGTGSERGTYRLSGGQATVNSDAGPIFMPVGMQLVWDYGHSQLTELDGEPPVRLPTGPDLVPPALARRLLAATATDPRTALPARRIAGIAAAGVRFTPASRYTTVGRVDVWADPKTGLPLEVDVTGRGAGEPFLTTRFLDVSLRTPDPAVLTPPPVQGGIGYTVTTAQDVVEALGAGLTGGRFRPLPDTLAGQPRSVGTVPDLPGVATYGTGLAQFIVVTVPRQVGYDAEGKAMRGGGVRLDFPDGDGVLIHTSLVSVLAMDSHPVRANYLLAGLVDPALLKQAGSELSQWGSVR